MLYPKFLKDNSTIGIVAMSSGVGSRIEEFERSISTFKNLNYNLIETDSVSIEGIASNTAEVRGEEFNSLINNSDIDMIINAAGGDLCLETLPYIDFNNIVNNKKWIIGASDPTSILYVLTTGYDLATLYGFNATSFDDRPLHKCQENALDIIKGNLVKQSAFDYYESKPFTSDIRQLDQPIKWETINGDFKASGRIIGGCVDVLRNLLGTPYDYTTKFIEKYKDDGIIWYLDNFALTVEDFYLSLLQMKMAGWFKYTKAVIFGRVMFPKSFNENFEYKDALIKIFNDIPMVTEACVGHVFPKMVIINGSYATVECKNNTGSITFELK